MTIAKDGGELLNSFHNTKVRVRSVYLRSRGVAGGPARLESCGSRNGEATPLEIVRREQLLVRSRARVKPKLEAAKAIAVRVYLTPEAHAALERIAAGHSFRTNLSAAVERLIFDESKRQAQPLAHALDCVCHRCTYVGSTHPKGCRCDLCTPTNEPKGIE